MIFPPYISFSSLTPPSRQGRFPATQPVTFLRSGIIQGRVIVGVVFIYNNINDRSNVWQIRRGRKQGSYVNLINLNHGDLHDLLLMESLRANNFNLFPHNVMYQPGFSYSMPKHYRTIEQPKTFPEDIECIIRSKLPDSGSLFISNVEAASNPATLKKLKIGAILSCAKGYELNHPRSLVPHYRYIPTLDQDECDISVHFDDAADFIRDSLRQTNVLAHCIAGVSRSVSMVIAYLIREHKLNYDQAYRLVKSKRKIIHPNDGFIRQLRSYSQIQKTRSISPRVQPASHSLNRNEVSPSKELTPKKGARESVYQRYQSTQLQSTVHSPTRPYKREEVVQSMPMIPDADSTPQGRTLTPKHSFSQPTNEQPLTRTSTSYFTPGKGLVNQRPYESIRRYEDFNMSVKLERPTAAKPSVSPLPGERTEFFASKNNELNEKIEMIRKKYAAQRQKLYSKYQSPVKQRVDILQEDKDIKTTERRRGSLGDFKSARVEERPYAAFTDIKRETYQGFDSYGDIYSKKYERTAKIGNPNQQDLYYTKTKETMRQTAGRVYGDYDRAGFGYQNYPPYYKYANTGYKRYY